MKMEKSEFPVKNSEIVGNFTYQDAFGNNIINCLEIQFPISLERFLLNFMMNQILSDIIDAILFPSLISRWRLACKRMQGEK